MTYRSQTLSRVADNLYRTGEGTYFARLHLKGKNFKKSLKTHDRKTAERKLAEFVKKIESEQIDLPDLAFEDAAAKWLESLYNLKESSRNRRIASLKAVTPSFKGRKLRALTNHELSKWAATRSKEVGARTFNIDRETLSMLFDYAKKTLKIIEKNPAKELSKMKVKKATVVPPTREQFKELVAFLDVSKRLSKEVKGKNSALFVRFLAYTGMRLEEARNILWKHVDFDKGTLLITGGKRGTKNHSERTIPLFSSVRSLLEIFPEEQRDPGSPIFDIISAKGLLKTASKAIGLPEGEHFGHHDMRHFFCSNALEHSIPDYVIASWLGHKDGGILVKNTYGHLRKSFGDAEALKMTFKA